MPAFTNNHTSICEPMRQLSWSSQIRKRIGYWLLGKTTLGHRSRDWRQLAVTPCNRTPIRLKRKFCKCGPIDRPIRPWAGRQWVLGLVLKRRQSIELAVQGPIR